MILLLALLCACAPSEGDSGTSPRGETPGGMWQQGDCLYVEGAPTALAVSSLLLYAEECWETSEGVYCQQLLLERLEEDTLIRCTSGETWRGYAP